MGCRAWLARDTSRVPSLKVFLRERGPMLAVSGAHDTLGPSRLCQKDRQPSFSTLQSDRARRLSITSNTTYSVHARMSTKFAAIANQATEGKSERVRNDADLRRDRRDRGDDDLACRRTLRRNADHDVTDLWECLELGFECFLAWELVYRCKVRTTDQCLRT